jgi:hypothetical protein
MIKIQYKNFKATFNSKDMKWKSEDKVFERVLNDSAPEVAELSTSIPWKEGPMGTSGIDGLALEKIIYLGEIKIVEYIPTELPKEKIGVVY